ncbi:phosphotransferase [Promicromonospora sp. NPDC050249]|uniref:phosphotransferase n=1 Tax=Promicromonospora sp. NPDC050249 TaxID=3154743 RepID=UPI0033CA949C
MLSLVRRATRAARARFRPAHVPGQAVLREACRRVGHSAQGAELVGRSVNTVYRLAHDPVVVRIRPWSAAYVVEDQIRTARLLVTAGAPLTRPLDVEQPVRVGAYVATFWVAAAAPGLEWQTTHLGYALHALHAVPAPERVPRWDPFSTVRRRIMAATYLDAASRAWCDQETDRLERAYRDVAHALPTGILHGDAHVANLLRGADGRPVLADLDSIALGPQLVDLTPTAVDSVRFCMRKRQLAMVEAYGTDVTRHEAWPVLRRVRELSTTTFGLLTGVRDPRVAALARHRLRTLQDDDHEARWHGYGAPRSVLDR